MATKKRGLKKQKALSSWSGEPLLKWPGGKSVELKWITPLLPTQIDRYFEPFVGGGALWLSLPSTIPAFVNDISRDLIDFYSVIKNREPLFFETIDALFERWTLLEEVIDLYSPEAIDQLRRVSRQQLSLEEWAEWFAAITLEQEGLFAPILSQRKSRREWSLFVSLLHDSLLDKGRRILQLEEEHGPLSKKDLAETIESALKAAHYYLVRELYNYPAEYGVKRAQFLALFWFVREYAYASMFRLNSKGEFNVPYGGNSYNRKDWRTKVAAFHSEALSKRLESSEIFAVDFEKFLQEQTPGENDFLFIDPPYDSSFSSYDGFGFGEEEHRRLADLLINRCRARWLLVIQSSPLIETLYRGAISQRDQKELRIGSIDKTYRWTIKERNRRSTRLLVIANYSLPMEEMCRAL